MRPRLALRTGVLVIGVLTAALCPGATGPAAQNQEEQVKETHGLPPRMTPADYQAHAQAGTVTVAAEFSEHSVPTAQGTLTTEDYVAVEVALFGPPEARTKLSANDFSLRINEKKTIASQPFGVVFSSLKDPEWQPPETAKASKPKTSFGGGGQDDPPPGPPKIPIEVQRSMQLRVQKAALPEGDRLLPQAGLLFFQYRGKRKGIHSLELIYSGPAGKATIALQP